MGINMASNKWFRDNSKPDLAGWSANSRRQSLYAIYPIKIRDKPTERSTPEEGRQLVFLRARRGTQPIRFTNRLTRCNKKKLHGLKNQRSPYFYCIIWAKSVILRNMLIVFIFNFVVGLRHSLVLNWLRSARWTLLSYGSQFALFCSWTLYLTYKSISGRAWYTSFETQPLYQAHLELGLVVSK